MTDAKHTLAHLLDLADKGPALRAALAEEIAELLMAWPEQYPLQMRVACEALLEKAARDVDANARTRLRERLRADPYLAVRMLPRETAAMKLVAAARRGGDMSLRLAQSFGLAPAQAEKILGDPSALALAVACKAAHIDRAAFSALALLCGRQSGRDGLYARLEAYDAVSDTDAPRRFHEMTGLSHAAQ